MMLAYLSGQFSDGPIRADRPAGQEFILPHYLQTGSTAVQYLIQWLSRK